MGSKKTVDTNKSKDTKKDAKKEIEDKSFGQKNKRKSGQIKKQLQKLEITTQLERKRKREEQEQQKIKTPIALVQPKAPIGVDPKTIPCVFFKMKLCLKGDKCKYGHETVKKEEKEVAEESKKLCLFLVDALNKNEYRPNWICPDSGCRDMHNLTELENEGVDIGIEEVLEMKRINLKGDLTPMTEELFIKWRDEKEKNELEHRQRIKDIKEGVKGKDMFEIKPEMFVDDDEGDFIDYNERDEIVDDEEEENTAEK